MSGARSRWTPVRRGLAGSQTGRRSSLRVQKAVRFLFHDRVAFARELLELGSVEHRDLASAVTDDSGFLELSGCCGDAFAPNTEHVGYQLLRHPELVRPQPIQRQQ